MRRKIVPGVFVGLVMFALVLGLSTLIAPSEGAPQVLGGAGTYDINGVEFILDVDADTSITADTDDQIDFGTGASDRFRITSTSILPLVPIDMNGVELILDVDADTSITADADDQIDFRVGGNDIYAFTGGSVATFSMAGQGAFGSPTLDLLSDASSSGAMGVDFVQGSGNGDADNMAYRLRHSALNSRFELNSEDIDGASAAGDIWRILDGTDDLVMVTGNLNMNSAGGILNVANALNSWNASALTVGSGDIDLGSQGSLDNVGAAGNSWDVNFLTVAEGALRVTRTNETSDIIVTGGAAAKDGRINARIPASGTGQAEVWFTQGNHSGAANNMGYIIGYQGASDYLSLESQDTDGGGTTADIWRVLDGQLTIDANTTWDINVFDVYRDAELLAASISPTAPSYEFENGKILRGRDALIEVGVLKDYDDGFVGYNDQRMAALLAGGIYQSAELIERNTELIETLAAKIEALELELCTLKEAC